MNPKQSVLFPQALISLILYLQALWKSSQYNEAASKLVEIMEDVNPKEPVNTTYLRAHSRQGTRTKAEPKKTGGEWENIGKGDSHSNGQSQLSVSDCQCQSDCLSVV